MPHHIYIGDSTVVFVPAPGDEQAAVALSALIHALEETGMGAIVKYAFRNNVEPKIGVLTAHIKLHYEVWRCNTVLHCNVCHTYLSRSGD